MTMADVSINYSKLANVTSVERIGGHSHVRGLGLGDDLQPPAALSADGLVGQQRARRAAGIVQRMVKEGLIAGRAILLSGQPGTGKTALAMGLAKGLGNDTPFVHISGSELYSLDISKAESLTQAFRRAIGVHIEEETDVIEGEVIELELDRRVGTTAGGESSRRLGRMTLATTDMETLYNLGPKMIEQLVARNVTAGDVIQIVRSTGVITKLGRSFARSRDFDAHGTEATFVKSPEGELQRRSTITHRVTLHDLDVINSRTQGFLALFAGDTGEIKSDVRSRIDEKVGEWRREAKATVVPGILFIDEVHALDEECFSFLSRAIEADLAPILVMATNRGVTEIKGTAYESPHGIPLDLLDRCLIIPTQTYSREEIGAIISERCSEEGYDVDDAAAELLTNIAADSSLRYALHILTMSYVASARRRKLTAAGTNYASSPDTVVMAEHVRRCYEMFADAARSAQYLVTFGGSFLYNDVKPAATLAMEEEDRRTSGAN